MIQELNTFRNVFLPLENTEATMHLCSNDLLMYVKGVHFCRCVVFCICI